MIYWFNGSCHIWSEDTWQWWQNVFSMENLVSEGQQTPSFLQCFINVGYLKRNTNSYFCPTFKVQIKRFSSAAPSGIRLLHGLFWILLFPPGLSSSAQYNPGKTSRKQELLEKPGRVTGKRSGFPLPCLEPGMSLQPIIAAPAELTDRERHLLRPIHPSWESCLGEVWELTSHKCPSLESRLVP